MDLLINLSEYNVIPDTGPWMLIKAEASFIFLNPASGIQHLKALLNASGKRIMISINATLLAQLIHFLLLLFIMNRLMLQPLLKLIREREAYTVNTKSEIKDIEVKIGQLKEEFIAKEKDARKDAARDRTDMMNVGMGEADGFLNTSREKVSSIRQQAEKEVEAEVTKTQPLLADQASSLVSGIMEKIIGRRIEA